jgi:hypothetical protein
MDSKLLNASREFDNLNTHSIENTIYWLKLYIQQNPNNDKVNTILNQLTSIDVQLKDIYEQLDTIINSE